MAQQPGALTRAREAESSGPQDGFPWGVCGKEEGWRAQGCRESEGLRPECSAHSGRAGREPDH